jgi:hypothetical protein
MRMVNHILQRVVHILVSTDCRIYHTVLKLTRMIGSHDPGTVKRLWFGEDA